MVVHQLELHPGKQTHNEAGASLLASDDPVQIKGRNGQQIPPSSTLHLCFSTDSAAPVETDAKFELPHSSGKHVVLTTIMALAF